MADDDGNVTVRFSQEGGEEILAKLDAMISKLGELTEASKKSSEETEKTGETLKGIGSSMNITALATGATAILELGSKAFETAQKVGEMAARFIEAAAHDEQLTIQIASLTEGVEGFAASVDRAKSTMLGLKDLKVLGDEDQLATTFRKLTLLVGGTSTSISELTNRMSLFAQQNGVTTESLLRVIQMAERTGTLPMRGNMAFASLALQRAGITGQGIQEAGAAITGGDTDAMDKLLQKVQVSKDATDALENSWKNLGQQYDRAKGEIVDMIGEGFEPLKDVVKEIIELLKSDEVREAVASFADALKSGLKTTINETASLIAHLSELVDYFGKSWGVAKQYFYATSWEDVKNANAASGALSAQHEANLAQLGMQYHPDRSFTTPGALSGGAAEATWEEQDPDKQPGVNYIGHHEATEPKLPPIGPDTTRQIEAATDALKQFENTLDQKLATAGLEGVAKTLKDIEVAASQSYDQLDKEEERLSKLGKGLSADKDFELRAKIWETQWRASIDAVAQAYEQSEKKREALEDQFNQTVTQMRRAGTTDAIELIEQETQAQIDGQQKRVDNLKQALDDSLKTQQLVNNAMFAVGMIDSGTAEAANVAAYQDTIAKKKALDVELAAFKEEMARKAADREAMLTDQEYGIWDDYYARLMQHSKDAHENMFAAAQENAQKVASAMEKTAQTAGEGMQAATAKIYAGLKSFGQDVAATFGAIWGQLTSSFEEGFYDILTGKFDSLKDVLKGLWDSILKDFSKMLAQMLERWLLTGEAMGNGQGGQGGIGGVFSSLLGGGGNNAVYTPGGTANATGGGFNQYGGDYIGTTGYGPQGQGYGQQGGGGATGGYVAGGLMAVYGLYQNFQDSKHNVETPTYNGVSLGQQDFGGNASFGKDVSPFLGAAGIIAAGSGWTGVGLIVAAVVAIVGVIVAGLNSIFNGPKEGSVSIMVADAWDKAGGGTGLGQFTKQVLDSSVNYMIGIVSRAGKPEEAAGYAAKYQAALKDFFGSAYFKFSAGSGDDLRADVKQFYEQQFPKMALQVGFGQFGDKYGWPTGNRDTPGGFAGLDWNQMGGLPGGGGGLVGSGYMDKEGKWIKQQLYDPDAPIPAFLAGIGFSQEKIAEIATKLAGSTDIKAFKTYLEDLVGIVTDLGTLAKEFGRTREQWYAEFKKAQDEKGTAAEFKIPIANLLAQGQQLDNLFGDERVTAAKQLVTDSQTLLGNMANALASIYTMIDAIQQATKDTIQSYREKLMTPAEREAAITGRLGNSPKDVSGYVDFGGPGADLPTLGADWKAVRDAANPEAVQKAWQNLTKDLTAMLDIIVARIQAIKSLQQSYKDFEKEVADRNKPQFGTDPSGWLAQNAADIAEITAKLPGLTGDEAIQGAQTLLDLTRERYNNEVAQLAKINGMIQSISEQGQATSDNLRMQAMGHVVTDPKTGQKTWVADTHAQGEYLKGQYDDLMGQLANAKTPEEVQKIYNKMQGIISQLAAQPQDPEHYAESRQILANMNDKATKAATDLLKKWGKELDTDIAGTGDKLAAGETALTKALDKAQKDFEKYTGYMTEAASYATDSLNTFADGLIAAMGNVEKAITHWTWVMTHPDTDKDPNWDYDKNQPKGGYTAPPETDKWEDDPTDPSMQVCVSGPNKGKKRRKPGAAGPQHGPDSPTAPTSTTPGTTSSTASKGGTATPVGATSTQADLDAYKKKMAEAASPTVNITINSGTAEEIAQAAADAAYEQTLDAIKKNNVNLVRQIRDNPILISQPWQSSVSPSR